MYRIGRSVHRGEFKRNISVAAGRSDSVKQRPEQGGVAGLGQRDRRGGDILGGAVDQRLDGQRGLVARAFRSTGRVAALSWLKSVRSVCHCLVSRLYFQGHDTLPVSARSCSSR